MTRERGGAEGQRVRVDGAVGEFAARVGARGEGLGHAIAVAIAMAIACEKRKWRWPVVVMAGLGVVVVGESGCVLGCGLGCFVVVDPPAGMVSVRKGRANKVRCTRWTNVMCRQFGNYSKSRVPMEFLN